MLLALLKLAFLASYDAHLTVHETISFSHSKKWEAPGRLRNAIYFI